MAGHRIERINELIKQELGKIILQEIDLPAGSLVTITRVETTKDLQKSRILISILPPEVKDEILTILQNNTKHLRYLLANTVKFRIIPEITFELDLTEQKATRIDELIDKIQQES